MSAFAAIDSPLSGPVAIANPIHREATPRNLTWTTQEMPMHHNPAWYVGTAAVAALALQCR